MKEYDIEAAEAVPGEVDQIEVWVLLPVYDEEDNVAPLYAALVRSLGSWAALGP